MKKVSWAVAKLTADAFIRDVAERPQDMRPGDYTIEDVKTKRQWWISNGYSYFGLWRPYEMKVGLWHGIRCYKSVNKLKAYWAEQTLKRPE